MSKAWNRHGLSQKPIYFVWQTIKSRCFNDRFVSYRNYGGRGIRVYDAWINDFVAFHDYVSSLPNYGKDGYSIDRIDNDGNYEPGNIRWADKHTQETNKAISPKNKSGYTGVYKTPFNRWGSYITVYSKRKYIGWYGDIKDAVDARNKYIIDNELTEYKIQEYESC